MTKPDNPRPDKARADDFGEDTEIPTYTPKDSAGGTDERGDTSSAKASSPRSEADRPADSPKVEAQEKKAATTHQPATAAPSTQKQRSAGNIYERTGRAAPQAIPPRGQAEQPQATDIESDSLEESHRESTPLRSSTSEVRGDDSNDTVVMPRAGAAAAGAAAAKESSDDHPERSRPLASDAPTSARDTRQPEPQPDAAEASRREPPRQVQPEAPRRDPAPSAAQETVVIPRSQPATDADYDADYAPEPGMAAAPVAGPHTVAADVAEPVEEELAYDPAFDHRRGTLDFGVFVLRVGVGAILILAGVKTFFQLGDSEGLSGLENDFGGYAMPWLLSVVQPSLQLLAGVFLLLGLLTPVAAAVGIVATTLPALHQIDVLNAGVNPLNWPAEVLFCVVMVIAVLALQFTGPGKMSLDFNRSWTHRPLLSSWLWVIVGGAAAAALWWFGAGVNPLN
ncbi:DoxX [Corynebacterium ciconiae DSM 44920]|uniref:DoxX family protein n=1 Tax=Corynebacterium ciconiae TaxID=227319 RepID=UPI0003821B13|nr:DoxX family protein [Corynebacterium ciconiae]WKD61035.1 DoxX [Corynebacterium ciconiae DSM 44920]